jgi:hypothetical protein
MLDVVTSSFYIKAPGFERQEFQRHSTELFDAWDKEVESRLNLPDYSLSLVVEEGSIKANGTIAATAAALYLAIGNYGSFMSGLQTLEKQIAYVTDTLFDQAKRSFGCSNARGNSKRSGGEILYLKNLFEQVQSGRITPDQAVNKIRDRWGEEAASTPKFLQDLASSLAEAPRYPEQLSLPDHSWDICAELDDPDRRPKPRPPRFPEVLIPQHYRIEIFRPSKGEKKKVKLTKLK